jgi:hypothetical protein
MDPTTSAVFDRNLVKKRLIFVISYAPIDRKIHASTHDSNHCIRAQYSNGLNYCKTDPCPRVEV